MGFQHSVFNWEVSLNRYLGLIFDVVWDLGCLMQARVSFGLHLIAPNNTLLKVDELRPNEWFREKLRQWQEAFSQWKRAAEERKRGVLDRFRGKHTDRKGGAHWVCQVRLDCSFEKDSDGTGRSHSNRL